MSRPMVGHSRRWDAPASQDSNRLWASWLRWHLESSGFNDSEIPNNPIVKWRWLSHWVTLRYAGAFKPDKKRKAFVFTCSCFCIWPGNLINPRQIEYVGEAGFGSPKSLMSAVNVCCLYLSSLSLSKREAMNTCELTGPVRWIYRIWCGDEMRLPKCGWEECDHSWSRCLHYGETWLMASTLLFVGRNSKTVRCFSCSSKFQPPRNAKNMAFDSVTGEAQDWFFEDFQSFQSAASFSLGIFAHVANMEQSTSGWSVESEIWHVPGWSHGLSTRREAMFLGAGFDKMLVPVSV